MLTSCGVYSKKISDWTGFDLIIFLVITLIIGFFWYLIMEQLEVLKWHTLQTN